VAGAILMSELDRVFVRGLEVWGRVGVYPFEHEIEQRLLFDVQAELDLEPAARDDDLRCALDYDAVSAVCRGVVHRQHHQLIETIAHRSALEILALDPRIQAVEVEVHKPGAVPDAADVSVRMRRTR
jgi:dihydroneopterin aldolase